MDGRVFRNREVSFIFDLKLSLLLLKKQYNFSGRPKGLNLGRLLVEASPVSTKRAIGLCLQSLIVLNSF
jgi:hypothetical protein